jgi:hypothetical protein
MMWDAQVNLLWILIPSDLNSHSCVLCICKRLVFYLWSLFQYFRDSSVGYMYYFRIFHFLLLGILLRGLTEDFRFPLNVILFRR